VPVGTCSARKRPGASVLNSYAKGGSDFTPDAAWTFPGCTSTSTIASPASSLTRPETGDERARPLSEEGGVPVPEMAGRDKALREASTFEVAPGRTVR
jgi:hypothetical protein